MILSNLTELIGKLGFMESYIRGKTEEVLDVAKKKNLRLERDTSFLVCYDINGPLANTHDAALYPLYGVREAMVRLDKRTVQKALVSGWDITTLKAFRDQRLHMPDLNIVGEHGTMVEWKGNTQEVSPITGEQVYDMKETLFRETAKEGLKIAIQGNRSSRITGMYFEAESPERGNLSKHMLIDGKSVTIKDILQSLRSSPDITFNNRRITFPFTRSWIEEIDRVLRTVLPLHSVRLSFKQDSLVLWVDHADRQEYSLEDMRAFLQRILPDSWKVMIHDDFGADIMFADEVGEKITKETTSLLLAEKLFNAQPCIITHVGDRPSDVFTGERSIFFAQKDTAAEQYCRKYAIPHVSVEHGGDYSLILAMLLEK